MDNELTAKQERFCEEYVIDFNATQAAIRAGYSKRTANEQGSRMLAKVSIQEKVKQLTDKQQERLEISADYLTSFFKSIIESEAKDSDRIKAAESLAKRIGFYGAHNTQKATMDAPNIIIGMSREEMLEELDRLNELLEE